MLSLAQFYGGAYFINSGSTITPRLGRVQVIGSGAGSTLTVLADPTLAFGGPSLVLFNATGSGGTKTILQASGALCSLPVGSSAEIFKISTRYIAFVRAGGSAPTSNSGGRTVPIGATTVITYPAEPTTPPRQSCLGAYRQARRCDTDSLVDCWTLDSDIPSIPYYFFGNVQGGCCYFSDIDSPVQVPGTIFAIGDLTNYSSCSDCLAANPCSALVMSGCPLLITVSVNLPPRPPIIASTTPGVNPPLQAVCSFVPMGGDGTWAGGTPDGMYALNLYCENDGGTYYWVIHLETGFETMGYTPDVFWRIPKTTKCPPAAVFPFWKTTSDPDATWSAVTASIS